ncbi:MAG: beta-N-acetylhexosaminidase [Planctomycetaceae bacterium]|nr:beta-N-acetylhexosaminidase [Planctomycetaceae bacterium]
MAKMHRSGREGSIAAPAVRPSAVCAAVLLLAVSPVWLWPPSAAAAETALIPLPADSVVKDASMMLLSRSRIVMSEPALAPLAKVLAGEIWQLAGLRLATAEGAPREGDIALSIDASMGAEAYELSVGKTASVRGGTYAAAAMGTATLLQAMTIPSGGVAALPHMQVNDRPLAPYRGLMVDVARQRHSVETLKQLVVLCRWYKINTLQLHLTDDQSFTFPSRSMPGLATPGRQFTLDELTDLETYARDRGVAILPELDMPGHATAAVKGAPERLACDPPGRGTICAGNEDTYRALDTLVGEMCDVFKTSAYFHIGADEVSTAAWSRCRNCRAYMARNGLDGTKELYRHFIVRMNEIVKRHGRKMIVWEGFGKSGAVKIPADVTVMVFESMYNIAPDVLSGGHAVINTAWQPLYVTDGRKWSPQHIYGWNMYRWEHWAPVSPAFWRAIVVPQTDRVLGAQICAWDQNDPDEMPSLRQRLAAMAERTWNPHAGRNYADFAARLKVTDEKLDRLVGP